MLIAQRPTLAEEVIEEDRRSRFVIEPLEPGFGYTLGNSLRRTLLSSIPGAAVTSVRIDGVPHEFRTIAGVKEDVAQIILNIKDLVLSSDSDEPVVMQLAVEGPGDVTAGDIVPPASVTGTPKLRAMELLDDWEADARGVYCGAIGMARPDRALDLNVAIRTVEIAPDGALALGVGGGITIDSDPAREWQECLDKAASIVGSRGSA